MQAFLPILKNIVLFDGFSENDILSILSCLSAKKMHYNKDESLILSGLAWHHVGIMLRGSAQIKREDSLGNVLVVDNLGTGDLFGEAYACAGVQDSPISIWALQDSQVLWLDYAKILNVCSSACSSHMRLIKNMLKIMATKLISLNKKLEIVQKSSIREKLTAFFELCMLQEGNHTFKIHFTREGLSNYLGINRSALSRELSKMRNEGLIDFSKNQFQIKY